MMTFSQALQFFPEVWSLPGFQKCCAEPAWFSEMLCPVTLCVCIYLFIYLF